MTDFPGHECEYYGRPGEVAIGCILCPDMADCYYEWGENAMGGE
jgi:hypothetical protein